MTIESEGWDMHKSAFLFRFLVVLGLLIVMGGCSSRPKVDNAPVNSTPIVTSPPAIDLDRTLWPVIVAFGDSLTSGQGVAAEKNYPSLLQAELDQAGYRYRVVNAGISGNTSRDGLGRIDNVMRHKPEIAVLVLGGNDGLRGLPVAQMKGNLTAMIERFLQEDVKVVLGGMEAPPNWGPDYTRDFRDTFVDLAKNHNLPFVPFFLEGVAAKPELNQSDGIHPTTEGYQIVVENLLPVLTPILSRP